MAATQYIGARYVPLFFSNPDDNSNNWKSGVAYDPLTVVTDLNQSYTSKIPVPASVGRPSENPTYWILTGAYSAQIEQYRQEVEAVIEDVESVTEEVENINNTINPLIHKKYIFLGDSYDTLHTPSIAAKVAGYMGIPENNYIDLSVGGRGFVSFNNQTWLSALQAAYGTIESPESYTDMIVYGGANDTVDVNEAALLDAMAVFNEYVKNNFPNVKIHLAFCGWTRIANNKANYRVARLAYYKGASMLGWDMLGNVEFVLHNYDYLMTSTGNEHHPTPAGATALAQAISGAMNGDITIEYTDTVTFTSTISGAVMEFNCDIHLINDRVEVHFGNLNYDARNASQKPALSDYTVVGNYNSKLLNNTVAFKELGTIAQPAANKTIGYVMMRFVAGGVLTFAPFFTSESLSVQYYSVGGNDKHLIETMSN